MNGPREPRLSAFFSPAMDPAAEPDVSSTQEMERQLRLDDLVLHGEIARSQRSARCVSLALLALLTLAFAETPPQRPWALALMVAAYAAIVYGIAPLLPTDADPLRRHHWVAPVIVLLDVTACAVVFRLTQPSELSHRFLIVAPAVIAAAGFYFGWRCAALGSAVCGALYLVTVGAGAGREHAYANLAIFAAVAATMCAALARFGANVIRLRMFCRQVADGDVGMRMALTKARYPDAVTALSRSIDAMRKGLAEQIGADALTGYLNRRALESRLRGEWRLARRRKGTVAVLAIDVDRFKSINDTYGHQAGDVVLQQFAAIMRAVARESDVVARLGGDEFVVVLPDTDAAGTQTLAERLRERVEDHVFGTPDEPLRVTISVGAAIVSGEHEMQASEIIAEADRALYQSKQRGRNKVSLRM